MTAPTHKTLLKLQSMEMRLVRAYIARPDRISASDYRRLRYILGFSRLHRFSPGAARGGIWREDVEIAPGLISPFRELVLRALYRPLQKEDDLDERLSQSAAVLEPLVAAIEDLRPKVIAAHQTDFSEAELDAEVGRRALVTIAGGGGGSGYVYIGAAARLRAEGMASDYLVGASIGALIGAFLARSRKIDLESILQWAKGLRTRDIFGRPNVRQSDTLPGLLRLHLAAMDQALRREEDGEPIRLSDLEIPYEAIVGGVRTKVYDHLPDALRGFVNVVDDKKRFSRLLAERMMMLGTFANPNVVKPLILGRDSSTSDMRAVDAVGLSAAIPGVLQYEPKVRDSRSDAVLAELRTREEVARFVDGGVIANVPARIAWEGVREGRIGTRNAFFLALDCFHPQFEPQHLWLWPVTQIVQLQLNSQRPYFDWLLRFEPTLSPVNLLPSSDDFDRAFKWGWNQAEEMIPFLKMALEPVDWK